jgi:DNA-binding MarR family transcriptional regulator
MVTVTRARGSPSSSLAESLHSLAIHLLRRVRAADRLAGLSGPRLSALSVLVFGGPRSLGALAQAEQVSAASMSRLVAGLVSEKYIRRRRDPTDARAVVLEPTAAGRALLRAGRTRRVAAVQSVIDGMTAAEQQSLSRALLALQRELSAGQNSP